MQDELTQLRAQAQASLAGGRLHEARELLTRLCELDGHNEEVWLMLAAVQGETGSLSEALASADRAVELDPSYVEAWLARAHLMQRLERPEEALESARSAVERDDEYGEAWLFLAGLAGRLNRAEEAERWADRAAELLPASAEARIDLGHARYQLGRNPEAEVAYRRALELAPGSYRAGLGVAKCLAAQGEYDAARDALQGLLTERPDDVEALDTLGVCHVEQGRREEAVAVFEQIIDRQPDYGPAYLRAARLFAGRGDYLEAIDYLKRAREHVEEPLLVLGDLAGVYHQFGMPEDAIRCCDEALELDPDNFEARLFRAVALGNFCHYEEAMTQLEALEAQAAGDVRVRLYHAIMLERLGRLDEARELVLPFLDEERVPQDAAVLYGRLCHRYGECDRAVEVIESALEDENRAPGYRLGLLFTLGKLLDRRGEYDAAFSRIEEANRLKPYRYDHQAFVSLVDRLSAPEVTGLVEGLPLAEQGPHPVRPVFIVGMPRSGTSLVEQIIASHPRAWGGGERHEISSIARRVPGWTGGTPYPEGLAALPEDLCVHLAQAYAEFVRNLPPGIEVLTDKMPDNYQHLVLIRLLFPEARIIHCVRDPRDICLSCYFQDFAGYHDYAYDLADLGRHYQEYRRLMGHYRDTVGMPMMEVVYEDLVRDTERVSRELVEYCGLEWDERCLRYYETDRVVRTASYDQVSRPIYTSSVDRWRHYERHLGPLLDALGEGA